jgi:hypothetical protein
VHESSIEIDGAFALGITGALAAADSIINFLWEDKTSRGFFRHLTLELEKKSRGVSIFAADKFIDGKKSPARSGPDLYDG